MGRCGHQGPIRLWRAKPSVYNISMVKYCGDCGEKIMPSDKFCTSCGSKLDSAHQKSDSHEVEHTTASPNSVHQKRFGLNEAITTCFNNYANFKTRSTRSEYWFFVLFQLIIYSVVFLFIALVETANDSAAISSSAYDVLSVLGILFFFGFWVLILVPSIAVTVRRLHDVGSSGWMLLIYLIPYVGPIIIFVFLVGKSEKVENKWGNVPRLV